ncbi:MAG: hypothetical protein KKH88_03095 [Nanoarchaeota archaeon]|nr:hypothetical protein [Nanoarchaeota archaeon]
MTTDAPKQEQVPTIDREKLHSELSDMLVCGNDPTPKIRGKAEVLAEASGYECSFHYWGWDKSISVYTREVEGPGTDVFMASDGEIYHAHLTGEDQIRKFAGLLFERNKGTYTGPLNGRRWAYGLIEALAIATPLVLAKILGAEDYSSAAFGSIFSGFVVGSLERLHCDSREKKSRRMFKELSTDGEFVEGRAALEKLQLV